jgi:hypothetical protein
MSTSFLVDLLFIWTPFGFKIAKGVTIHVLTQTDHSIVIRLLILKRCQLDRLNTAEQ